MKFLLFLVLVLAGVVGLALLAQQDPGYVLLAYREWTVETSLSLLVVTIVIGFGLLYAAIRLIVGGLHLPGNMSRWRRERRANRARQSTRRGLIALAEGNWKRAERYLIRDAADSDLPLINYLGAARAAQKLGSEERRDDYLARAHQSMPDAELAVGLTQAEVQLSDGQTERALATLMHLRSVAPKHGYVLYLLKRLYEKLTSWDELLELTPELRRQKVLSEADADALERRVHAARIDLAVKQGQTGRLNACWEQVPKRMRNGELLIAYAEAVNRLGDGAEAEQLLRDAIRQQWEPELVRLYGLVRGEDPERQLAAAESWLADHERQPDLLLTLGRLCLRNQLWGKARAYLEASVGADARSETYCELGNLLDRLGEAEQALECYRRGVELAAGNTCTAVSTRRLPLIAAV